MAWNPASSRTRESMKGEVERGVRRPMHGTCRRYTSVYRIIRNLGHVHRAVSEIRAVGRDRSRLINFGKLAANFRRNTKFRVCRMVNREPFEDRAGFPGWFGTLIGTKSVCRALSRNKVPLSDREALIPWLSARRGSGRDEGSTGAVSTAGLRAF